MHFKNRILFCFHLHRQLCSNTQAMKSAFGAKRKPRKIEVDEDEDGSTEAASSPAESTITSMYIYFILTRLADGGQYS